MRRLEARVLALAVLALDPGAGAAQLPPVVTLEEVWRMIERNPRVAASRYDADAGRAERVTAGVFPNPSLWVGRSRPSGGERTIFDAQSKKQATIDLPIPIFGQLGARERAAERQVGRAETQIRLTQSETRRQSALEFVRLLTAQEQLAARRAALTEVDRIRALVAGRLESGMASRYDVARAEAELGLAAIGVQRAESEQAEHAAALAGLVDAPGWRPRAAGSLAALRADLKEPDVELTLARSPAARAARDDTSLAEARI